MNFSCFQLMQSLNVQVIWNVILTKYVSKDLVFLHVAESVVAKMLFVHQNFIKENANAFQDSLEPDVKNFAKKGIGDKIATNHANAIAQILFVIQLMVVFVDQAIEVKINQ